jgi:hypothetical protein
MIVYCTPIASRSIYTSSVTTTHASHHDRDLNETDYVRVTTRSTTPVASLLAEAPALVPVFTSARLLSSLAPEGTGIME